jgi:hypothetical protein
MHGNSIVMKLIGLICLLAMATSGISATGIPRKLINERSYPNSWKADMSALDLLSNALHEDVNATGIVFVYGRGAGCAAISNEGLFAWKTI